jgi:hypothetical protein
MFVHLRADLRYKIHESGAWSSYILIYQVQKVSSRESIDQLCYVLGIDNSRQVLYPAETYEIDFQNKLHT